MATYDPMLRLTAVDFPLRVTRLGTLERSVIALSRRDDISSLAAAPVDMLVRRLFGCVRPNRLADPRLELLRRYAVQLRHGGDALAAASADALVTQGFTADQVAHARWLVARERHGAAPGQGVNRVALACAILVAIWAGLLAGGATHDRVVGLAIALLAGATLAPLASFAGPRRARGGVAPA